MSRLIFVAIIAMLSACTAAGRAELSRPEAFDVADATYRVSVECQGGHAGGGSAVMLQDHVLVTAGHVGTSAWCRYELYQNGTYRGPSWLLKAAAGADLALLYTPLTGRTIELGDPWVGAEVWAAGYPGTPGTGEQQYAVSRGTVASRSGEVFRVTAPIYHGSSGGGAWDDQGRLVGITVGALESPGLFGTPVPYDGWYYMEPADRVSALLEE